MENKNIVAAVIVLALIIAGMFTFAQLKKNELNSQALTPTPTSTADGTDSPYAGIDRIEAKHFFENGTHTIVGEVMMPTPCDLLNWSTRIQESMPETAIVDFDVINHSDSCIQVITPQRFKATFQASDRANIRATLEGQAVELNLIPAEPGETPEDYELFIKG